MALLTSYLAMLLLCYKTATPCKKPSQHSQHHHCTRQNRSKPKHWNFNSQFLSHSCLRFETGSKPS
ncbi:hypothetical protein GLYMA_03G029250v4 [Glycine max]|nr:hypothetical protein GLYMA_03G029250v4 [Glycine max]KAH1068408.1 hypothetical protein GYH30_006098 [Glycine max]